MALFGFGKGVEKSRPSMDELNQQSEGSIDAALDKGNINRLLQVYQETHDGKRISPEKNEFEFKKLLFIGEKIATLSKRSQEFLSQEVGRDLGIKFSRDDFEGVTSFLEHEAVKNIDNPEDWPPFLKKIEEQIDTYHKLKEAVAEQEEEVKQWSEYNKDMQTSISEVNSINWFKRWTGMFLNGQQKQAMSEAREVGVGKSTMLAEIKLNREKAGLSKLEKTKSENSKACSSLRSEILKTLAADKAVITIALDKFHDRLRSSVADPESSLKDLDQVQSQFDRFDSDGDDEGDKSPIDYFQGIPAEERGAIKKQLNEAIQNRLTFDLKEAVENFELGNNQLTKMEKVLGKFLSRDQVGVEKGKEAREYVLNTLKVFYDRLEKSDDPKDQIKCTLIERVLFRSKIKIDDFKGLKPGQNFQDRADWAPPKPVEPAPEAAPIASPAAPDTTPPATTTMDASEDSESN